MIEVTNPKSNDDEPYRLKKLDKIFIDHTFYAESTDVKGTTDRNRVGPANDDGFVVSLDQLRGVYGPREWIDVEEVLNRITRESIPLSFVISQSMCKILGED
jgi:hypothetical protein